MPASEAPCLKSKKFHQLVRICLVSNADGKKFSNKIMLISRFEVGLKGRA